MSPDKQRIAIAEACGWTWEPFGNGDWWNSPGLSKRILYSQPPDYLNDLNAMHEAEKVLTPSQDECENDEGRWVEYGRNLSAVCSYSENERVLFGWLIYRATAAQRAEAFLRTIGKWEAKP